MNIPSTLKTHFKNTFLVLGLLFGTQLFDACSGGIPSSGSSSPQKTVKYSEADAFEISHRDSYVYDFKVFLSHPYYYHCYLSDDGLSDLARKYAQELYKRIQHLPNNEGKEEKIQILEQFYRKVFLYYALKENIMRLGYYITEEFNDILSETKSNDEFGQEKLKDMGKTLEQLKQEIDEKFGKYGLFVDGVGVISFADYLKEVLAKIKASA